jgi:hypothetical protein
MLGKCCVHVDLLPIAQDREGERLASAGSHSPAGQVVTLRRHGRGRCPENPGET